MWKIIAACIRKIIQLAIALEVKIGIGLQFVKQGNSILIILLYLLLSSMLIVSTPC